MRWFSGTKKTPNPGQFQPGQSGNPAGRPVRAKTGRARPLNLPKLKTADDCVKVVAMVFAEANAGRISTAEARNLCQLVDKFRLALQAADVEARLEKLEEQINGAV